MYQKISTFYNNVFDLKCPSGLNILSVEYFIFADFFAVKVDGSDVNPGICLINLGCFNIQTSHGFENFCLFLSNSTYSVQTRGIYFQYVYHCVFNYNTDSWVYITSVNFTAKKVHEDEVFNRQDILQFFSDVSKD